MDIVHGEWSTATEVPPDVVAIDKNGVALKLLYHEGTFFNTIPNCKPIMSALPDLDTRKDDVFLSANSKCGTNWVYDLAYMLLRQDPAVIRGLKHELYIEYTRPQFRDTYPSPRVLNTHVLPKFFPRRTRENKNKVIFLVRNPKDVVASFYRHTVGTPLYDYKGTFDGYFDLWMDGRVPFGSYFDYLLEWEKYIKEHPEQPILVVHYEHLKKDLPGSLRRLARFLGVPCSAELVAGIVSNATIEKMTKVKKEVDPDENYMAMFGKGVIGDWKNVLSNAQSKAIDVAVATKMAGSMFKFDYGDE